MANHPPREEDNNIVLGEDIIPGQYQENTEDSQNLGQDFNSSDIPTDEVEIENPVSAVASAPAKNILILGVLVVAAIFFLYKFVFKDTAEVTAEKKLQEQIASQPTEAAKLPTKQEEKPQVNIGVVETPELPAIDNMQPLPPPVTIEEMNPLQPPEPVIAKTPELDLKVPAPLEPQPVPEPVKIEEPVAEQLAEKPQEEGLEGEELEPAGPSEAEIRAKLLARRKIGMLVMNGGGTPKDIIEGKSDPNAIKKSGSASVTATKVDDLSLRILQGKMIDAVLETTINTDLPGSLRAVISRDIYAESGKNVLIPKGSRLIGSYSSGITPGQQRIVVSWGRVIRPDGVDIDIASTGTDQLGRAGMSGIVDNKYFEMFSNSILVSALTIGGSIMVNKVQTAQATTTSTTANTDGSSTTSQTANPTDAAVMSSVQGLGDTLKQAAQGFSTQPTIIVNQGARIKVFVNKDLVFPASVVNRPVSVN